MKEPTHKDFITWADAARKASIELWGYEGLMDDDPDSALQAYLHGESPWDYILALGEDLDLFKATKYWMGGYGI